MSNLKKLLVLTAMLVGSAAAFAASHGGALPPSGDTKKDATAFAPADMTQGEIRKVDMDNKKITIKHGEIKNLDMPGMTMVFTVRDKDLLATVKPGDKIKFMAVSEGGKLIVTDIQPIR